MRVTVSCARRSRRSAATWSTIVTSLLPASSTRPRGPLGTVDFKRYMSGFSEHFQYLAQKPDIYRCIRSCRDQIGFYEMIQIMFGTVQTTQTTNVTSLLTVSSIRPRGPSGTLLQYKACNAICLFFMNFYSTVSGTAISHIPLHPLLL